MFFECVGIIVCVFIVIFFYMTLMNDCDLQLKFYEKFGKSPDTLRGKVVIITGASSGIGEYTAYALAKYGVKLSLTARRLDELIRVKRKCIKISNGLLQDRDVVIIPADITDFKIHAEIIQLTLKHLDRIDILLNNAGRSQRALFEEIEMAVDREMFELNVFAVVNMTRLMLDYFNSKGRGHVAVVSSMAGVLGVPNSASYTASKHAIHGYYDCIRTEKIGKNIDVTIVCPGPTFTNFLQESFTGKPNEKYNIPQEVTDKCMSAQRCGHLIAVALANKTTESWIVISPMLTLTYLWFHFPSLFSWALNSKAGREWIFKKREHK